MIKIYFVTVWITVVGVISPSRLLHLACVVQVPLSDETVAVRVAELVDGVIQQLLTVWDKLEPVAFVGSGVSAGAASLAAQAGFQMPPDGNIGEALPQWARSIF